jgi:hypothetical protein
VTSTDFAQTVTTATTAISFSSVVIFSQVRSTTTTYLRTTYLRSTTTTVNILQTETVQILLVSLSIETTDNSTGTLTVYTATETKVVVVQSTPTTYISITEVTPFVESRFLGGTIPYTTTVGALSQVAQASGTYSSILTFQTIHIFTTDGIAQVGPSFTISTLIGYPG